MPLPPCVPAEDGSSERHQRSVRVHTRAAEAVLNNHMGFCRELISGVAVLPLGGGE